MLLKGPSFSAPHLWGLEAMSSLGFLKCFTEESSLLYEGHNGVHTKEAEANPLHAHWSLQTPQRFFSMLPLPPEPLTDVFSVEIVYCIVSLGDVNMQVHM